MTLIVSMFTSSTIFAQQVARDVSCIEYIPSAGMSMSFCDQSTKYQLSVDTVENRIYVVFEPHVSGLTSMYFKTDNLQLISSDRRSEKITLVFCKPGNIQENYVINIYAETEEGFVVLSQACLVLLNKNRQVDQKIIVENNGYYQTHKFGKP